MSWKTTLLLSLLLCPAAAFPVAAEEQPAATARFVKADATAKDLPDSATEWVLVRDSKMNLFWEVKTADGSLHDKDREFTWEETSTVFLAKLNEERFGGFADWRLPSDVELKSIIERKDTPPFINEAFFPNTPPAQYWDWYLCGTDSSVKPDRVPFGETKVRAKTYRARAVRGEVHQ